MKNKKKIIIIFIILIILIGLVFFINRNNENNKAKNTLSTIAKKFYEETYYVTMNKDIIKDFSNKGINISIEELLDFEEKEKDEYKKYNLNRSKVIIYPKEPYNKIDYKIEIKLYRK